MGLFKMYCLLALNNTSQRVEEKKTTTFEGKGEFLKGVSKAKFRCKLDEGLGLVH